VVGIYVRIIGIGIHYAGTSDLADCHLDEFVKWDLNTGTVISADRHVITAKRVQISPAVSPIGF
jgi:hypothetical protein